MIGFCLTTILFIAFIVCYLVSKQYKKGSGGRLALELSALGSMILMVFSVCMGISGI